RSSFCGWRVCGETFTNGGRIKNLGVCDFPVAVGLAGVSAGGTESAGDDVAVRTVGAEDWPEGETTGLSIVPSLFGVSTSSRIFTGEPPVPQCGIRQRGTA